MYGIEEKLHVGWMKVFFCFTSRSGLQRFCGEMAEHKQLVLLEVNSKRWFYSASLLLSCKEVSVRLNQRSCMTSKSLGKDYVLLLKEILTVIISSNRIAI